MPNRTSVSSLQRVFPWLLSIGGAIGCLASLILTYDKLKLAANPHYIPSCNLNPVLSCGSVIKTWQASAFGFPNSFIGIGGFAIVTTVGMALLAGLKASDLKRWFWQALNVCTLLAVGLITWLQYQSIYRINALCPFCMVVWAVTIPIFWYTTLYNLQMGFVRTPTKLKGVVAFAQKHHGDILLFWFLIILAMITTHFWYYWKTII